MTPLERYQAYQKSKGLSETAATVTRPQSYNIRTGGVSQAEKQNIQKIRDRQAADREANRIQQEKFWNITTAKKDEVPKIILSQPNAPNTSKGNLSEYFKERNIDPLRDDFQINTPNWMQPVKQTELRNEYASKMKKSTPTARKNSYSFGANTQTIDLPLAAESPVKENDFLPPSETPQQIFDFTPINSGRIELNPSLPKQITPSTPAKSDNSKYFVIGGIAIAALVLFLILRRRK